MYKRRSEELLKLDDEVVKMHLTLSKVALRFLVFTNRLWVAFVFKLDSDVVDSKLFF